VQRTTPEERCILRGRTLTVRSAGGETVREIADAELPGLLRARFEIEVSDDDARRALGGS
jgi:arylamine N-acetyltransferase